ncbi:MAG: 2-oxo acid dehydrogenase subunit E2 [Deltaproteobacteria bacterium]|nr:2-oxo acid dehydrogenase subunit E2 [Deltaproteobacteria bacterium]
MIELKVPKLGMTMESAKLLSWKCRSGDLVKKEDVLFVIETDKITYEVPSPADGIAHPAAQAGKTYAVAHVVGYLADDRNEYDALARDYPAQDLPPERPSGRKEKVQAEGAAPPPVSRGPEERIKVSPLARRMAADHNLELGRIMGTGPGGRIVKKDILMVLESLPSPPGEARADTLQEDVRVYSGNEVAESIPIEGVRRVIFDNMLLSLTRSAQLTLQTEASAEALLSLRNDFQENGTKISFNAILLKIAAMALRRHPGTNASVDGDLIRVWKQIHIGLAMEAEGNLVVPVVRSADHKTIGQIEGEIEVLLEKARENTLLPDDLAHGTFTLSNLGFVGVDHFTPIIRPPESAILGVGRMRKKPAVRGDQVVAEVRMGLSLTFDHRLIDGAPAGRFLRTIKEMIEKPALMLM